MNSGPLSLRTNWGVPYVTTSPCRIASTLAEGNDVPTARANPSRVNSSMTVNTFRGVPLRQRSWRKS
jgi:hypothetical protein